MTMEQLDYLLRLIGLQITRIITTLTRGGVRRSGMTAACCGENAAHVKLLLVRAFCDVRQRVLMCVM